MFYFFFANLLSLRNRHQMANLSFSYPQIPYLLWELRVQSSINTWRQVIMTPSGLIIDFFYGRSFSIHSQAPSVGTETQDSVQQKEQCQWRIPTFR